MMSRSFRDNQIVVNFTSTEVYTILSTIRAGYILEGKTATDITNKIHDALVSAGRDPDKYGFPGKDCQSGICKLPKTARTSLTKKAHEKVTDFDKNYKW